MLAHEFQTCGVCWESHRNDKTYSPGSRVSGTSTKSLNAHWSIAWDFLGRFTFAHSDPSGVVPILVETKSIGSHPEGLKYSLLGCQ